MNDRSLFEAINAFSGGPVLDAMAQMAASSRLGLALGAVLLVAILAWRRDRRDWRLAVILVLSVAVCDLLCAQLLKPFFEILRPCHQWPESVQLHGTLCGGAFSFPSNHAANNAALVAGMFTLVPLPVTLSYSVVAAFIAWSRIYVGAHFPSDVAGGLLLGTLVGWAVRTAVLRAALRLQRT